MTILVCECGKRLKAAGAAPGRVGRCPACGALLRVADEAPAVVEDDADPSGYALASGPDASAATYVRPRAKVRPSEERAQPPRHGLVRMPAAIEAHRRQSWLYPLWDAPCVGVLAFMPGLLWLTSLLSFGLMPTYWFGGQPEFILMAASLMILAMLGVFALLMGRVLFYLEQVLITSAQGDVAHPRLPLWDFFGLVGVWGRLAWSIVAGGGPMAFLAILYWIYCGDIDWADAAILGTLATVSACAALMAFVAVVLHGDVKAANPITVLSGLRRVGWAYGEILVPVAAFLGMVGMTVAVLFRLPGFVLPVLAAGLFWVLFVYGAMVVCRWIGLFHRRHAKALGWFVERPTWGR